MAYLDSRGLGDLWERIGGVFARMIHAAGSASLSGTNLILTSISGGQLSSVPLGDTFVTKSELDGATSGVITQAAADGRYARSITYNESTNALTLRDGNGNALSTVYIN